MFQGFYNATSGVLTQTRKLDVISNNMTNISTPGYKADEMVIGNFSEVLEGRSEGYDLEPETAIGEISHKISADQNYINYAESYIKPSKNPLDFAIKGPGFFTVKTAEETVYTRNGGFVLDEEGFVSIPGLGRVQGEQGDIKLNADGTLSSDFRIVDFQNYEEDLIKRDGNTFLALGNPQEVPVVDVYQYGLEASNVDPIEQMTSMMEAQRALQSSTQIMKLYDDLAAKVASKLSAV